MLVKEVMATNPKVVNADTTLREAAMKLRESNNGGVMPVAGSNGALIGVITEDDISVEAIGAGRSGSNIISDILIGELHFCFEGDDIQEARLQMQEHQVSCLVVLDNNERMRLVGTIALADIPKSCNSDEMDIAAV